MNNPTTIDDPNVLTALYHDLIAVAVQLDCLQDARFKGIPDIVFNSDAIVAASEMACPGGIAVSAFSNFTEPKKLSFGGTSFTFQPGPRIYFRSLWNYQSDYDRKKSRHEMAHYLMTCILNKPVGEQEPIAISMETEA